MPTPPPAPGPSVPPERAARILREQAAEGEALLKRADASRVDYTEWLVACRRLLVACLGKDSSEARVLLHTSAFGEHDHNAVRNAVRSLASIARDIERIHGVGASEPSPRGPEAVMVDREKQLREHRDRLESLPAPTSPSGWSPIKAWVARVRPLIVEQYPAHLDGFEDAVDEPCWASEHAGVVMVEDPWVGWGGTHINPRAQRDADDRVAAASAANARYGAEAKANILACVDGLLSLGPGSPRNAPVTAAYDAFALYEFLVNLLPSQFEEVMFRLETPSHFLPAPTASPAERAMALVKLLRQGDRLAELSAAITAARGRG